MTLLVYLEGQKETRLMLEKVLFDVGLVISTHLEGFLDPKVSLL